MTQKIYLSRHGQVLNNVIHRLSHDPIAVKKLKNFKNEHLSYEDLISLSEEYNFSLEDIFEHSGKIANTEGRLVGLEEISKTDLFPSRSLTGKGREQAQRLGNYLRDVDNRS